MGMLLGLATAFAWGSADFLARSATRTIGSLRAVLGMQAWGAVFLTILLLVTRDWGHLFDGSGWGPWGWGFLAGAINTFAMLALYRSFEMGKLALVGPISASYPALTVVLSLFSGERLSLARTLGIVAAVAGVVLVARAEKSSNVPEGPEKTKGTAGLGWASAAALSFGILFWLLGIRMIPQTGALSTVWLIRLTGAVLTFVVLIVKKAPPRTSNKRTRAQLSGMGFLDTAAFVLSNLGMRLEQVAVVSVLGSLYGAVTVAFAATLLGERILRQQWIGIAFIFLGVALMYP